MAVSNNPFQNWERQRDSSDYRSRETQMSSLTRQMMKRPEYLREINRVNPGPLRNTRAKNADLFGPYPERVNNQDLWGWQPWAEKGYYLVGSDLSSNLLEESDVAIGGLVIDDQPVQVEVSPDTVIINTTFKGYNHVQSTPSAEWVINHNLGFYPSVELLNSDNAEMEGYVDHISIATLRVLFNIPVSGRARLI